MKFGKEFLRQETDELAEKAFARAQALIERDEIKMDDFSQLYGQEQIIGDKRYVAQRESEFATRGETDNGYRENLQLSRVFEAILHEHGEQSNWFGDEATTVKTSRYDDIAGGVDEIVEFQKSDSALYFLALAIDATYNHDTRQKLKRIKGEIEKGKLATIKYFQAEGIDLKGELKNIPHVIVGADRRTLTELAELWLSGKVKELAEHPIQFQILEEILRQCEVFAEYAQKVGKIEIAEKYRNSGKIIAPILAEKRRNIRDTGRRDSVFSAMTVDLSSFDSI